MRPFFDNYDTNKLKQALRLLNEVYEYNYFLSNSNEKRLGTIISKLERLIQINTEAQGEKE